MSKNRILLIVDSHEKTLDFMKAMQRHRLILNCVIRLPGAIILVAFREMRNINRHINSERARWKKNNPPRRRFHSLMLVHSWSHQCFFLFSIIVSTSFFKSQTTWKHQQEIIGIQNSWRKWAREKRWCRIVERKFKREASFVGDTDVVQDLTSFFKTAISCCYDKYLRDLNDHFIQLS